MLKLMRLLHHAHTGKVRPHEHTSYFPLAIILLAVGLILTTYTATAWDRPGPAAGSVGLSGVVPGKPPTQAGTIKTPSEGQHFSQTPIVVSGTCPKDSIVEVYKNDIFSGSSACTETGTYSFEIDLLIGQNTLVARVYDALNQQGPDSNTVSVFYDALPAQGSLAGLNIFGGSQLVINTDALFRGAFPNKEMTIPIDILGGRAPYAVNIQWGDATNKVVSRSDNTDFKAGHMYARAGTYQLSIQATDADGRVAFLTVASIVNGQPDPAEAATTSDKTAINSLLVLWPLYAAIFTVVISFWMGEWREKRMLAKHGVIST